MATASAVPQIFDHQALLQRLARARQAGAADFLLTRAAEDFSARLDATLRPFPRVLDLATPLPHLAAVIARREGKRELLRAAPLGEADDLRWRTLVCDPAHLPFAPESFDLALSAFALHWVNDLPGTLIQIRRALAPDGLFLACMAGGQTLLELRTVFAMAEEEIAGGVSPRVAPFADLRDMGGLLQRAGFALPVTDIDTLTVRYANLFA
ncbi:MAG: methyltransferase domain-containing protein, partial [Alphaproteobacteria bacterium]|nr:methyltransferase domain-containing protein [Alphaproteobacteria bacterium]